MKSSLMITVFLIFTGHGHGLSFTDDFEDGDYDGWTVGSRQEGRVSIADVASRNGTLMAHVYQDGFTGISLTYLFDYRPDLQFEFDMDTVVHSDASSTSSHFALGQAYFDFFDASLSKVGTVRYANSTSSYYWESNPHASQGIVPVGAGPHSFALDVQDVLSVITIDTSTIEYVSIGIHSYTSSNSYNMYAHTWLDNVVVTPEPSMALLLCVGGLVLRWRCCLIDRGLEEQKCSTCPF